MGLIYKIEHVVRYIKEKFKIKDFNTNKKRRNKMERSRKENSNQKLRKYDTRSQKQSHQRKRTQNWLIYTPRHGLFKE